MSKDKFEIDVEIKEEFLERYIPATRKRNKKLLLLAEEYELLSNKRIYNLNYEERDDLILTKYKNKTLSSVESTVSVLKNYIDFCISKNLVSHFENRFSVLSNDDMQNFVSKLSTENRYIPWSQIKDIEKDIYNDMDKLALELPYYSIRGKSKKDETCAELINLKIKDVDENNNTITVYSNDGSFRIINVRPETIALAQDVYNCEEYIRNNGEERVRKFGGSKIEKVVLDKSEYIFKPINTKKLKGQVHPLFFIQQIKKIGKWTGVNYLTINNLYFSGMAEKVIDIFNKTGEEPTKEDYLRIVQEADYGETAELQFSYAHKLKKLCKPYLVKRGE